MEASPKVKVVFEPSVVVAGRAPLNSISQTTLNQLPGEAGGASTPFERKALPVSSRGGAGYPSLGFPEIPVTPEKYVLPHCAATTTPRSNHAWDQLPTSSTGAETACCSRNFRPSCPLSPLTDQERATVGGLATNSYSSIDRILQRPNAVDSMSANGTALSSYYPSTIRPIARPSEGETRVGLASVPTEHVPGAGVVRAGAGVQASGALHLPRSAVRRPSASGRCAPAAAGAMSCNEQQFDMEEDGEFWKSHSVQVLLRIRPLNKAEIASEGSLRCVRQESPSAITWLGSTESRFTFDHVACESITQERLFRVAGLPMVNNCIAGYNSCIFAYGQTGSGKTYTMLGDVNGLDTCASRNRGITSRVFEELFARIHQEEVAHCDDHLEYSCKCSFFEIYNEQITDLLSPKSSNLQIREDARRGVYVENIREVEVSTLNDVIQLLVQGAANMKVAATRMNAESSRSHTVFTCVIESKWNCDSTINRKIGRLNLVDLAGSERQKTSGAEGEHFKEAANINRSLSSLGKVMMALAHAGNGKPRHVPYRDSKLTFLLQDSLGGNSKTALIANVSPSICCAQETLSTLKFAQRAKLIHNHAVVNEDTRADVTALRNQTERLKEEVDCLHRESAAWEEERKSLTLQLQEQENNAAIARDESAALAAELQRMKALLVEVEDAHRQAQGLWNCEKQDLLSKIQLAGSASEGQALRSMGDVRELDARLRRLEEVESRRNTSTPVTTSCGGTVLQLSSEFHEFENERTQRSIAPGQVWAVYEDGAMAESMPRRYALISEVSRAPFKVVMKRLAPVSTKQNLDWDEASGMRISCGQFKVGNERVVYNMRYFSHVVIPADGLKESIGIYPRKQDVWALYRTWDEKWPDLRKSRENRIQYDLVEIMSDFCDVMGVDVALLAKVSGFRTLFKRCQAAPTAYPAKDFLRFSHRVPAHRMAGSEVAGLPKDCVELDPLGLPLEFISG